jgi:uncharacterized protein
MTDELFRVPVPLESDAARTFWAAIDEGRLTLPRCDRCGRWQWYPLETGTCCTGGKLEWVDLPGTGSVFTWTVVRRAFLPELAGCLPLAVALLELDGTRDLRFVAVLDVTEPRIGMRVRLRIDHAHGRALPVFEEDHVAPAAG